MPSATPPAHHLIAEIRHPIGTTAAVMDPSHDLGLIRRARGARQMWLAKTLKAGQMSLHMSGAGGGVKLLTGGVKKPCHRRA